MALDEFMHFFTEEKISTKERNKLDDSQFGIPELRKYPLTDEKHVLQAVRFFNKAEEKYKPELARRIVKRAKELDMTWTQWFNHDGCMYKYRKDLSKEDQKFYALHARENDNEEKKRRHDFQKKLDKDNEKRREREKELKSKGYKESMFGGWYKEYAETLSDTPEAVKCLEALLDANVKYDKATPATWRLKSPESVIRNKKGNCHDISYYVYKNLDKFAKKKVGKGILFVMEYKEGSEKGGVTHSVCYEKIKGGVCFIEYSWDILRGTFPRNNIQEEIDVIKHNWKFSKGFDKLFFAEIKNVDKLHPGMTLDQYVKIATSNKEIISEAFAYDAITGERIDLGPSTMTEEELRSRMVHGNGDDFTSGTSLTRDNEYNEPDDCYCESDVNGLVNLNMIATKIHEKYEEDEPDNENCLLCSWCAESWMRGHDLLPRPVYSPRDPALEIKPADVIDDPLEYVKFGSFENLMTYLGSTDTSFARWYCHVKWGKGSGGHEFLMVKISDNSYVTMDAQAGEVKPLNDKSYYVTDIDWDNSYLCRIDDKHFDYEKFKEINDPKNTIPWDGRLDIPFMVKNGMLTKEQAEEYWKTHPEERPENNGKYLTYEYLNKMFPDGNPIQESFMMEFDHNSEKIPVSDKSFDKLYFGSPTKYDGIIELDRPLFVTPFIGIASIFIYGDLDIQNKVPRGSYNLQYEEWLSASEEDLNKPFKDVHVYVEGYPELEPYEVENTGYIHVIDGHEYAGRLCRYDWMADDLEYLIDNSAQNEVQIDKVIECTVRYHVSGKASNNPKLGPYKKNIQESAWQDIKNGVNPYSKNLVFHISKNGALDGQIFKPRVPEYITKYDPKDPKFEDNTTGRICFSPSIEGCLNAILVNIGRWKTADKLGDWYVYIPEKPLNEYKHTTNKDIVKGKKVYDANLTKEIWIEEPVRLKQYGVIHVDQVKASDRKHTVPTSDNVKGDRRYYTFKWHWLVKPKVLKDVKYDYSKHETTENLEEELWRFKYGLIKDGKLVKNTSKEDWYKYWRLADPEEFEEAKGGNCYDYVEWEAGYLDAFGYKCNKYFILASNGNTHAFIVVPDDGKFYFVDGAFNKIDGKTNIMKEFNSLQDCFEYITDAIKKYEKNESLTFTIYDYTNEDMKPGTPMKEFEEWITSHGKKVNINKSIKEAYNMSDFERDPSVFRMFMEADDDTDKDDDNKQEDTKESSDTKTDTDEEGDAIISVSTTEITTTDEDDDNIGTDDGSGEQNQYDPKEVEYLNKLIASEADAISEYFEYGKLTRVPVLSKLYTDIGDEERFHLEQLIYAKSYLTGDKYEPKDSKVRREYEELLELGMDEETAMTTAIDKTRLMPEDDITEEEIEEFVILSQMSEMMSFQNEIIMECMDDTSDIRKALSNANTEAFMESVFIMEDVSNLNTKQGQKELGTKNPIRVIIGMFKSIYRIIINLVKKAKLAFQKKRLKNKKKWAWIKKHGIKGLFQSGVSLYFWNDQTNKYEIADALKYLQMVWDTCNLIIKDAGITDIPEEKFSIQKIIQTLGADIKFKPMYVKNLDSAIKDLQGTMLSKSKLIVNDNNQEELEKLFFGYTDSGYATMEREGENSKSIDLSKNIYNQMNIVLDAFSKSSAYVGELLNRLEIMEGKSDTIYQKNNKLYNKCVQTAGELTKALNKFNAAVSHDISIVTKIDNGLMEAVNKADEGDKTDLNKLNDDRAKAKAEAEKTVTEEKQQTKTENQSRYNLT